VKRRLGLLLAGTIAFWIIAAGFVYFLGEEETQQQTLVYSAVAAGLCLVPMAATLLWVSWGAQQSPDQQMVAVLGGTGVRMFAVLGVGLLLTNVSPYFRQGGFWFWVLAFYLLTLTLEMVIVVRGRSV
jgi:hypothetical protein